MPLVKTTLSVGAAPDTLGYKALRTLGALDEAVAEVAGFTRYRIDWPATGSPTIAVVDQGGVALTLPPSRTATDPRLLGTKHRAAEEREVTVARGASDGRTVILVPEAKGAQIVGMTLLHVRFHEQLPWEAAKRVLVGYRTRYSALADAVTETEPFIDDERLGEEPLVDLLTAPVYDLAMRWRRHRPMNGALVGIGIDSVDISALRGDPGPAPGLARPAVHAGRAALRRRPGQPGADPGRPLRRQGSGHEGARRGAGGLRLGRRGGGASGEWRSRSGGDRPGRRRWRPRRGVGSLAAVDHPHRDRRFGRGGGRRVIPVLTPAEMAEVDRQATEPVEELIERAGSAVAGAARRMLGGGYGRRVVVVAGGGNNGADGRVAANLLSRGGAAVSVVEAADLRGGERLTGADLVVDAAYGTGLSRHYAPPGPGFGGGTGRGHPVRPLRVDRPRRWAPAPTLAAAVRAERTVTFAAYKPGLLLGDGPDSPGSSRWPTSAWARWRPKRPRRGW